MDVAEDDTSNSAKEDGEIQEDAPQSNSAILKVGTYNIHKGKGGFRGPVTVRDLAFRLGELRLDLLLCQEVFHTANPTGPTSADQSQELADRMRLGQAYGKNAIYAKGHHGNTTLSRHPIEKSFNCDLSTNPIERRGVLYCLVQTPFGHLHVLNTHLGLNRYQRAKQAREIARTIENQCPPDEPLLLAGDFNDWTGRLDQHIGGWCGLQNALWMLDSKERRSWPSFQPVFGLDRIYFRNLELHGVRVLDKTWWEGLSDHLPVTAEFGWPNRSSSGEAGSTAVEKKE